MYSTYKEPNVAEEDIECYKIVFKNGLNYFSALFFSFNYKFGEEYEEAQFQKTNPDGYIYRGFHTFNELEDAEREFRRNFNTGLFVIAKCVIPKGSRYWEGGNGWSRNERCSEKIRIVAVKFRTSGEWINYKLYP